MEYGELNNLLSVIIGASIISICCYIAYIFQKNLFNKKNKQ